MQPRSSSSTVQPLSRSRVLVMAAGAGPKLDSQSFPQYSDPCLGSSGSQRRREAGHKVGGGERPGAGAEWARPLLGRGGVAYCYPFGVKRSCPGMVQLASWEMD